MTNPSFIWLQNPNSAPPLVLEWASWYLSKAPKEDFWEMNFPGYFAKNEDQITDEDYAPVESFHKMLDEWVEFPPLKPDRAKTLASFEKRAQESDDPFTADTLRSMGEYVANSNEQNYRENCSKCQVRYDEHPLWCNGPSEKACQMLVDRLMSRGFLDET